MNVSHIQMTPDRSDVGSIFVFCSHSCSFFLKKKWMENRCCRTLHCLQNTGKKKPLVSQEILFIDRDPNMDLLCFCTSSVCRFIVVEEHRQHTKTHARARTHTHTQGKREAIHKRWNYRGQYKNRSYSFNEREEIHFLSS